MEHAAELLFAYWSELKGTAEAPRRFDIEPGRLVPILSHTFILEKLAPHDYRYRIAGTRLCEAFGRELREQDYLDMWSAADGLAMARALAAVTRRAAVVRFSAEARLMPAVARLAGSRVETVTFDGILLPLVHTMGTIDRVLGAMQPASLPDWIGTGHAIAPRLTRLAIEHPATSPTADPSAPAETGQDDDFADGFAHVARTPVEAFPTPDDLLAAKLSDTRMRFAGVRNAREGDDRQSPFPRHIRKARIVRADRRQFRVYDGGLGKSED